MFHFHGCIYDGCDFFDVVGGYQHGSLFFDASQQLDELFPGPPIQPGERFVQQQHFRLSCELCSDGHASLVSIAEVFWTTFQGQVIHTYRLHGPLQLCSSLVPFRRVFPATWPTERELFAHRSSQHVSLWELEHQSDAFHPGFHAGVSSVHLHVSIIRFVEPRQEVQERGFSRSAPSHEQRETAWWQGEVDVAQQRFCRRGRMVPRTTHV